MFARFFSTRERSNFIAVILLHRQRSSQSRAPSTTVRSLRELQWSPSPAIAVAEKCARPLVTTASPAMTTRNCIAAMRLASGSSVTLAKKACLERTGGDVFAPKDVFASQGCLCSPKREAERRTAHQFQLPRLDAQAQPRPDKRDRSPFGAPPRSCAGNPDSAWAALPGITGCKREDPLRHQCSEHLAVRHAPDGLIPKPPEG